MFSVSHLSGIFFLFIIAHLLFVNRNRLKLLQLRSIEISIAISLIIAEAAYTYWLLKTGYWHTSDSIPIELCSLSLFLTIFLLITAKKWIYELLLFTALLGASQALFSPVLYFDFPHFRFIHFFYTHLMMIWVALYFTWVKGYTPTIWSIFKVFVFLNAILPLVLVVNRLVDGNYMFLSHKPSSPSLLDYLGPHPWYILSLEALLLVSSVLVWIIFKDKKPLQNKKKASQ